MSVVSDQNKYIYVAGGRCATHAIEEALLKNTNSFEPATIAPAKYANRHMPAKFLREVIGEEKWQYFKFSFVRNPYSWVVSIFFRMVQYGTRPAPAGGIMTMEDFLYVVEHLKSAKGRRNDDSHFIRSQHAFLCDKDGELIVDFVGRLESLNEDFATVCNRIGIEPITLPVRNSSSSSVNWRKHYESNPVSMELVAENWERDFEHFGYKFEDE